MHDIWIFWNIMERNGLKLANEACSPVFVFLVNFHFPLNRSLPPEGLIREKSLFFSLSPQPAKQPAPIDCSCGTPSVFGERAREQCNNHPAPHFLKKAWGFVCVFALGWKKRQMLTTSPLRLWWTPLCLLVSVSPPCLSLSVRASGGLGVLGWINRLWQHQWLLPLLQSSSEAPPFSPVQSGSVLYVSPFSPVL